MSDAMTCERLLWSLAKKRYERVIAIDDAHAGESLPEDLRIEWTQLVDEMNALNAAHRIVADEEAIQ